MCTKNKIDIKQFLDDFLCENGFNQRDYKITPFMGVIDVADEKDNVFYFTESNFAKSVPDGGFGYRIVFQTGVNLSDFFFSK